MRIYYTAMDCGDGSLHVRFFDDENCVKLLNEHEPETYPEHSGGHFDCDNFTGVVSSMEEVLKDIFE